MQASTKTYKALGVGFDKIYYESNTYLEGKKKVEEGLAKGLFIRKADNSVWADLTNEGLDQKATFEKRWHFGLYDARYRNSRNAF